MQFFFAWDGAEHPWPSRGALKAGRCSELEGTPCPHQKEEDEKNAFSPFFDASRNKKFGSTICIGREIRCVPYEGF